MADANDQDEEAKKTAEPSGMSRYAFGFMISCLLMTSALVYYVWKVFSGYAL